MDVVLSQDFFPQIGGAHSFLYEVYKRWPTTVKWLTRNYDSTESQRAAVAAFDSQDHGSLRIFRAPVVIEDIRLHDVRCIRQFWMLVKHLRRLAGGSETTLHCLRAFPEGFAGLLFKVVRPGRARLVVFAHGEEVLIARSSRQLHFIAKLVFRFADLVIANSRSTESFVRGVCRNAKVVCIHPGVDSAAYSRPEGELIEKRLKLGWPPGTFVVTTIARMEARKNQASVINTIAALRQKGVPVAYVCVGDGEEREKLQALVEARGLGRWVHFPGTLSEEEKIVTYGASDLYVMASIQSGQTTEGFGIVFLEAAAAGVPSICGNVGGQPEAVLHGKTGLVVDGRKLDDLESTIHSLISDPARRAKMGEAGRKWAQINDWTRVSAAVLAAIRRACACS
jgi:phosphatidyl-myo-inositol dimannoside synthase